jgi:hypothetical protein
LITILVAGHGLNRNYFMLFFFLKKKMFYIILNNVLLLFQIKKTKIIRIKTFFIEETKIKIENKSTSK